MCDDYLDHDRRQDTTRNVSDNKAGNTDKKPVLLTAKEAADLCNISESMFRKLHKNNKTPKAVLMGNLKRWISTEIEAWILAGCPENQTEQALTNTKNGCGTGRNR